MNRHFVFYLWISMLGLLSCGDGSFDPTAQTLDQNEINRLIPLRGTYSEGMKLFYPDEPYKAFWVEGWNSPEQALSWKVNSNKGEYAAEMLVSVNGLKVGESVVMTVSNGQDSVDCEIRTAGWQRLVFPRPLVFGKGTSDLSLRINPVSDAKDMEVRLYSLELADPNTKERLRSEAQALRSNTSWMAELPYGFFFHWNSKSMPKEGEPLSYEEAVERFDVDRFAKTVDACGGKLVFFTTSWAEYYFPAPIQTIDSILPGRTTQRDLVADLSEALGKYGIRLILYYHVGHGDPEWWAKQAYTREEASRLFSNVEKIVAEISQRYGKRLAGLWMDDGIGYYPNGASFERITRAAKSGNRDLVICYNPWILPRLTDFQDYYAGETGINLESAGVGNAYLPVGGDGQFQGGPQEGLQATYSGLLEPGDWTHLYKDSVIGDPILSITELTEIVKESNKRKNLPMINVRIYQDGTISPKSEALLKELNKRLNP